VDRYGVVLGAFDDFAGVLLVEAEADELALLAAAEIALPWLA
jgi:hypothetical protein